MSTRHKSIGDFWVQAAPAIEKAILERRDPEIDGLLERATAIYAFALEDINEKRTKNLTVGSILEPLMVLGFDLLRGAHSAQVNQSVATATLCARTAWEATLIMLFITTSQTPEKYASRFHRFQMVERLKQHYDGAFPLSPEDVTAFTTQCPEWMDSGTNQPKRNCKWNAEDLSVKKIAERVGETTLYKKLYSIGSLFTHGSAIIQTAYRAEDGKLQLIADAKHVRSMAVVTVCSATRLIAAYVDFFGVPMPPADMSMLATETERIARIGK